MSISNIFHIKTSLKCLEMIIQGIVLNMSISISCIFNFKMSGDPQSNSQLSQVGSKDLKQEVLTQLQASYYRGSSNGSKKWTRCFEAYPRTCKSFTVTIWDKGKKTTGRRKRSHVPANSGSTITWCTRLWHPFQCFCYVECVMHHMMTFLAMCLLCRLCDSEEVFISGFHWINRKAVRLTAIPLMSQNSRLYNLSL
jgi:hypothetical protein